MNPIANASLRAIEAALINGKSKASRPVASKPTRGVKESILYKDAQAKNAANPEKTEINRSARNDSPATGYQAACARVNPGIVQYVRCSTRVSFGTPGDSSKG